MKGTKMDEILRELDRLIEFTRGIDFALGYPKKDMVVFGPLTSRVLRIQGKIKELINQPNADFMASAASDESTDWTTS